MKTPATVNPRLEQPPFDARLVVVGGIKPEASSVWFRVNPW